MSRSPDEGFLVHPLLRALGVRHGFGLRASPAIPEALRPRQVHGCQVLRVVEATPPPLGPGDAVVSTAPGRPVAVVTADCVPLLLSAPGGEVVAAVHAGWRGLAQGVVAAAVAVLQESVLQESALQDNALPESCASPGALFAAVGPHIGPCCYEIDEPVIEALGERFDAVLGEALQPTRPGHARLALLRLVRAELEAAGLPAGQIGALAGACTRCDGERFHSYRRDGAGAGRLVHWIAAGHVHRPGSSSGLRQVLRVGEATPENGVDMLRGSP